MLSSPPLNVEIREELEENLNNTNRFIPNFEFKHDNTVLSREYRSLCPAIPSKGNTNVKKEN